MLFIYLVDIAAVATFSFLSTGGNWWLVDFRKTRLGEYTAPLSLHLSQYQPEISHCSRNMRLVSSGKGLNFITTEVVLLIK